MADLGSYKEDSLDSEGIFDLEGMDVPHNGLNSDAYDSDTDGKFKIVTIGVFIMLD